ncbi:MAG TPA: NAD(P)H-dependent oxidoreductase [Solirubrobacterales bacterium]
MSPETDIRVVLGSTTRPGRLQRALEGAIERTAASGTRADLLDLATLRLGFADGTPVEELDDDTGSAIAALDSAPALILATPVYRGSLTGSLKNLLDLTPVPVLHGKVVGLVAMGATDHHYLGPERHLRDVLAFFGAVTMPTAVYLNSGDFSDGVPGGRTEQELDELFAGTAAAAEALADAAAVKRPPLIALGGIKPRLART